LQLGGPSWKVGLGRRDSLTANRTAANTFIPSPTFNLSILVLSFAVQGLSFKNMVALSGNLLVSVWTIRTIVNKAMKTNKKKRAEIYIYIYIYIYIHDYPTH
jgi:hypothetical protein